MAEETVTPPAPVDPAAAPAWHATLPAEVKGYAETQGWTALEAPAAFARAVEIARANQAVAGIDAARIAVLPKDAADVEGIAAYRAKVGVPNDVNGYDLTALKIGEADAPAALVDWTKATALALGLPKDQAAALAAAVAARDTATATETETVRQAKLVAEVQKLDQDWGANKEANLFVARQAAAKLGITPEAIQALEGQIGYAAVMQAMLNVGSKIGEDKWVANPNPAIPGVMSVSQAISQKTDLLKDAAFGARALAGDAAAVRQLAALDVLIAGEDGSGYRAQ